MFCFLLEPVPKINQGSFILPPSFVREDVCAAIIVLSKTIYTVAGKTAPKSAKMRSSATRENTLHATKNTLK